MLIATGKYRLSKMLVVILAITGISKHQYIMIYIRNNKVTSTLHKQSLDVKTKIAFFFFCFTDAENEKGDTAQIKR